MKSFNRIRCLSEVVREIIDEYGFSDVIVADIAADHGYLAELISRNEKVSKVYATDISQKCLDKTNELIKKFKLKKIETRLGDGLNAIDGAKISIIAGVGGYEIIKILSNQNITKFGEKKCSIFILQPSKNASELRLYLMDENVAIIKDFIVKSGGKFYPIIVVDLNKKNVLERNIFNLFFGHGNNIQNPDFCEYLNDIISRLSVLENLDKSKIIDEETKLKFEIYKLAKNLIKNYKGD